MPERALSAQKTVRVLVSLWLVYHLLAVVIGPIGPSYISNKLDFFFRPYRVPLHLDCSWSYFDFVEVGTFTLNYELLSGAQTLLKGTLPDPEMQHGFGFHSWTNAPLVSMRQESKGLALKNYLCKKVPGASTLKLSYYRVLGQFLVEDDPSKALAGKPDPNEGKTVELSCL